MSKLEDMLAGARDAATVRRVYGEPYEKDGVTIIPAAAVRGAAGGGEGQEGGAGENPASGSGGGFAITARPVGAYQIKDGEVSWLAAPDRTKVLVLAEVVLVVALLVLRSIMKSRRSDD